MFSTYAAASALHLCDWLINAIFDKKRAGTVCETLKFTIDSHARNHRRAVSSRGRNGGKEGSFSGFRFICPQHHLKMWRVNQLPRDIRALVYFTTLRSFHRKHYYLFQTCSSPQCNEVCHTLVVSDWLRLSLIILKGMVELQICQ